MKGDLRVPLCTNSCCEGQGTRLIGSMPEYIFSTAPDGLYINLFEPASIQWSQSGTSMGVTMSGNFPYKPDITLEITASRPTQAKIRVRVPSWAASSVELKVNQQTAATGKPGTYVTLDRTWSTGDIIHFTLPMQFKLTHYEGLDQIEGHQRYALEYGPILMALIGSDSAELKAAGAQPEAMLSRLQQDQFHPLHFNIDGHPQFKYVPYWQVISEPFTCFPVIDLA
jgi:DUF1680 family protein